MSEKKKIKDKEKIKKVNYWSFFGISHWNFFLKFDF